MLRRLMMAGQSNPSAGSDDFDVDSSLLYTITKDTGAPTIAIASSMMTITSPAGCQASVTRNGTSIQNGYVEADASIAQDSGLLFRFIDQNNFYLLAMKDDTSAGSADNLVLYKRVSGSFTPITSSNVTWPRGTSATIRLSGTGVTIKVSFNGTDVITITDGSISGPGKIGLRGNGPPGGTTDNKFLALRWG